MSIAEKRSTWARCRHRYTRRQVESTSNARLPAPRRRSETNISIVFRTLRPFLSAPQFEIAAPASDVNCLRKPHAGSAYFTCVRKNCRYSRSPFRNNDAVLTRLYFCEKKLEPSAFLLLRGAKIRGDRLRSAELDTDFHSTPIHPHRSVRSNDGRSFARPGRTRIHDQRVREVSLRCHMPLLQDR